MLSRPGSGSLSGPVSPDQSDCSSDTGSVLIRSTRARPRRHGAGAGNVQITVQKLRVQPPLTGQQLRQKPEISDAKPAAADREPGPDLLTSRFEAGGRGVVLAALKQRSHSAPHRREVRVQMLDQLPLRTSTDPQDAALSSQNATGVASVQREAELNSGRHGDDSSAAATAAAVVAAAAPLIKAQSDMEARVSQLADGVEKLLQADRHGEGRGRSLSQQTLQQLEMLQSQQLQLQSQLLESALRIVTGHAPTTSDLTAPGRPAHLPVTHLDAAANGRSSSATAASSAAVETVPVAMETCRRDRWPEQTRDELYLRGASTTERTHLQSSSNHSQETARRANEMLKEMRRLKTEMKMLLTPEDSLETSRPAPDHLQVQQNQHLTQLHQSQQNQTQQSQSKQNKFPKKTFHQNKFQQNQSQQKLSQQVPSQSHRNQSQQIQSQQDQSQYKKSQQNYSQSHQTQSKQNKSHQNQSQHKKSQQNQSQSQLSQCHQNQSNQDKSQQNQSQRIQSQQIPSQSNVNQCYQNQSSQIQSQHHQSESHQDQSQHNNSQQIQSQSQLSKCLQNSSHQNQSQFHQNQSQQTSFQDNPSTYKPSHFQQNQSQFLQSQSQQNQPQKSQEHHFHQNQHTSQQNQSHPLFHQIQPQQHQTHRTQSHPFQSVLVQRKPVVPSPLEEAGQVLRQVRRQKKVLEENLEALLRAKTGEVLHCQLEALAANRDWTEEVRIKKTVDAWISSLTRDIQAEMSLEEAARCRAADAAVTSQSSAHPGRRKPLSMPRTAGSRPTAGRGSRGRTAGHKTGAEPDGASGRLTDSQQVDGESYLDRLYGRAPYEGQRRTLKKSPYLRLNSPGSPLGRKPRLVESVRGVKLKSCKTQTSLAPPLNVAPPLGSSPGRRQRHHVFSSSHLTSGDPADLTVTPANSFPVAVAIPLGRPRIDSSRRPQRMTSSPPAPPPKAAVVATDDGSPEQQKQKQQNKDEAPPLPPSNTVDIIERKSEEEEEEEEENVFPGTDFLSVTDVIQQEVSVEAEEEVLLDGGPSPPPVLYQGPAFPPQAPSGLPAQDQVSVPGIEQQRDALETRLVEWVEQQLMSRIISDMYRPPQPDPAHNQHTDQSELEERSVTSDIVEAAGGGGLQLFVDSNTSVDSDLIRQLVNEVLTETVALMLGQRDTGPGPGPGPGPAVHHEVKLVPLVPTPVPTPPPSPTQPSRDAGPVTTPLPSEPTSPLNRESPQPITEPEPVATPPPSPEPGSPPAVQAPPPLTWGDAELPLDEERPEEHLDSPKQQLLMSVVEEEPPVSSPLPPPSLPPARSPSPPPEPEPEPEPASPSSSSESSSSSSSSSSSTVTAGTEAALRHISEGEMLISINQLAAMTEEEAVCSFSSSLQELQEMDLDPPSEGQIRGQDLLLINRMEERVASRGERPQPEGSWGREEEEEEVSVGEVRHERTTKPHRTTNPSWKSQTSSPGQISQATDVGFEATNQSSVAVGDQAAQPMGTLTSDLSLTPPPHLEETNAAASVVVVKQLDSPTGKQEVDDEGGSRKSEVQFESFRPDESISEASDSSSDVF